MSIKREQHKEIEFRAAVDEAMRDEITRRQSSIEKLMTNTTRMWIKTSDSNEKSNKKPLCNYLIELPLGAAQTPI